MSSTTTVSSNFTTLSHRLAQVTGRRSSLCVLSVIVAGDARRCYRSDAVRDYADGENKRPPGGRSESESGPERS